MRPLFSALILSLLPHLANADPVDRALEGQVLPGFTEFADQADALNTVAVTHCAPGDAELEQAFFAAWDAWINVSHLRFGPTETDNRAFALGYWPDSRGAIPKSLHGLIAAEDPVVDDPTDFAQVSIAARGFTALEFLLFDADFAETGPYGCSLVQAIATDIAMIAEQINSDWQSGFAEDFAADPLALETLYGSAVTGLQFTSEARLGRPLGTFERPRPTRAEARRSGRSLHHVDLSLMATRQLAELLAEDPNTETALSEAFDRAQKTAASLEDPVFAGVSTPIGRVKVEALQQVTTGALTAVRGSLGPALGVAEGFNALDGD